MAEKPPDFQAKLFSQMQRVWDVAQTAGTWSAELAMGLSIMFMAAYAVSTGDTANIPNWVTLLATGFGPNIFTNWLAKWAQGDREGSEVAAEIEAALAQLDFESLLTQAEFQTALANAFEEQAWLMRMVVRQSENAIVGELVRLYEHHNLLTEAARREMLAHLEALLAGQAELKEGLAEIKAVIQLLMRMLKPTKPPLPMQKPEPVAHFTGREDELTQLLARIKPGQVATICGPGGIGKTALVSQAIWTLAPGGEPPALFPDGIVTHSFYNRPQVAQALEHIIESFGGRLESGQEDLKGTAQRLLGQRQALLLLDGAEEADDLATLLEIRSHCGVIVTSRKREGAERQDLPPLPPDKAVELLQKWGGQWAAGEKAASQICRLVGRLPLAVRLAGSYMGAAAETAAEFLADLEMPLRKLDMGKRRQESVPVLLEKSLAQVSGGAQQALALVGLLALDPFDREVVAAGLAVETGEAGRRLGELVRYGLLERRLEKDNRYEVGHALVHTYARRRLEAGLTALQRLAAYYARLLSEERRQGTVGLARLDAERSHVVAVIHRCQAGEAWETLLALAGPAASFMDIRGYWTERSDVVETALAAAQAKGDLGEQGKWLNNLAAILNLEKA